MCQKNNKKEELLKLIPKIVATSRTGDYAGTARQLNFFLSLLQKILSSGKVDRILISKITYSLETLLAMQQMENWVAFADVLEYEFFDLCKKLPD